MTVTAAASPAPLARRFFALVAALAIALAIAGPSHAAGNPRADQVRSYNAQALALQADARRSAAASPQASANAGKVLAARAAALLALIEEDPTLAEKLAFPASVLQQLSDTFPDAAASLEQRGHWSGELEVIAEMTKDLKLARTHYRLRGAAESLEVRFAGGEPPGLQSGTIANVGGVRVGRKIAANEIEPGTAAAGGTTTAGATTAAATSCGPTGAQNVLAVLVNLKSSSLPASMTQDYMRGVLLGNAYAGASTLASPDRSVDDYWRQNSDGKTWIEPAATSVVGPITLSSDFNTDSTGAAYCDFDGLAAAAIAQLDPSVNFLGFNRLVFVMPNNGACSWAGLAYIGCGTQSSADGSFSASKAWEMASSMGSRGSAVQLSTHEMGHNLGLHHASSRDFGAEPLGALGATGTLSEYGDTHSTMGSWNYGFYAAGHAANQLGWLASGTNYVTVETAGTYTIQNYEARPAGLKALKVRRGTGNNAWLWIEARRNIGLYDSALPSTDFSGALIHYEDSQTGIHTHLLDFTPATDAFGDAALQVGQTWTDPYSNVSVSVTGVAANSLTVAVNYGPVPCTPSAPTISVTPTTAAQQSGTTASYSVSVTNNDNSVCASQAFSLSATAQGGLTASYANPSLTLAPGTTGSATLSVGVPTGQTPNIYTVAPQVSGTSGTASTSASITVTEPTYTLTVGTSGSGSVSLSSPVKTCTSSCTATYAQSAKASVTLTAKPGTRSAFSAWTGACSGITTTTCTVAMTSNLSAGATFTRVRR